jgi:hypothetical protein
MQLGLIRGFESHFRKSVLAPEKPDEFAFHSEPRYHFNRRAIFVWLMGLPEQYASAAEKYANVVYSQI